MPPFQFSGPGEKFNQISNTRAEARISAPTRRNVVSKSFRFRAAVCLSLLSLLSCAAVARETAARGPAGVSITLNPSLQSPQMLGTSIVWTATVQNAPPGHTYDYQFSLTFQGQNQIVRDFA